MAVFCEHAPQRLLLPDAGVGTIANIEADTVELFPSRTEVAIAFGQNG